MSQKMNNFNNTGAKTLKENDGDNRDYAVDDVDYAGETMYNIDGSGEFSKEYNIRNGAVDDVDYAGETMYNIDGSGEFSEESNIRNGAVDDVDYAGETMYNIDGSNEFSEESNIRNGNVCQHLPRDEDTSGIEIYDIRDKENVHVADETSA